MDAEFVRVVERALKTYGEELVDHKRGLNALGGSLLTETRKTIAVERLVLALAAVVARNADDPLRTLDEVRRYATGPLKADELPEAQEHLEQLLAKLEAFAAALPPGPADG